MKLVYTCLMALGLMTAIACNKDKRELRNPPPLLLLPKHDGKRLSDADLNSAQLYYFRNNNLKKQVADFRRGPDLEYQKGVLSTKDIAALSAIEDINIYYLSYANGREDTIQVAYKLLEEKDAKKEDCFCDKPLLSIHINGKTPVMEGENKEGVPIYTYNR